jgi:hypothetical protein
MNAYVRRRAVVAFSVIAVFVFAVMSAMPTALAQGPASRKAHVALIMAGPAGKPSLVPPLPKPRPGTRPASATINVRYTGFTSEAREAFQYAVDIWAAQLTSSVPIEVVAVWEPLGPGVLGAAGPTEVWWNFGSGRPNVAYPVPLANKLAGRDLNPGLHDLEAYFSSEFDNWYFGTDGITPPGTYDFVTVVLHELGHGLGFLGSMQYENFVGSWGYGNPYPFVYDTFAENGDGESLTDTSKFPNPSIALGAQLVSGSVFFDSPRSRAANNGEPPELYAPFFWQAGSSYSHLDELRYGVGDPDSLMTPQVGEAEAIHDPGDITRAMFEDMGWTIDVPVDFTEEVFLPLIRR